MFPAAALLSFTLLAVASAQQIGTNTAEVHPSLTVSQCTTSGGCTSSTQSIVLDANWRWLHSTSGYTNCYTGNQWNSDLCPDPDTCATNCALDGASYESTYGISTDGNAVTLNFVTQGSQTNVGSRVYLLSDDTHYQTFSLLNKEFSFDVDASNIGCGINGAVYFVQMDADGGLSKYSSNKAGAQYGTGYCDSQCPQDIKFINGEANLLDWNATSANSGTGSYGSCCPEMDIWEANKYAAAYTPHPCSVSGQTRCTGTSCGAGSERYDGYCDKDGCDFNSWRMGNETFLGPGMTIDTNKKFTIVTQFITDDNTANGTLSEIRRLYVQGGTVIQNSVANQPNIPKVNSITDSFCTAQKTEFGDQDYFGTIGGLSQMGKAMSDMVLVMSIWDDYDAEMLWLDSNYPTSGSASTPGISRGPCSATSGLPATVESQQASASVTYSNIKWGDIGSTYSGSGSSGSSSSSSSSAASASTSTHTSAAATATSSAAAATGSPVPAYGQCGGQSYTGSTTCASPYVCKVSNAYYSQCLPA
uniref:Glucanase n=1 Tax=Agroathelia rolfsii TaxID=39291 RepID=Q76G53_9AGAM|nr:cellobiohydrolase (EC 3.2.1.91) - Corticium rolfsii (Strain AHU9627) [Agroathelia rolfsii]BAC81967.1 cellobiohydrolase [Agroathelia rolfsii]